MSQATRPGAARSRLRRLFAALAAVVALAACSGKGKARPPAESVPVLAATVERKTVPIEISAIGHVEALSTVAVKTRVGGEVTQVAFREGQDVQPGDLLFVIDRRPYEAALNEAHARLERDRALAKNADQTAARYAELVKKDFVTAQQYDEMQANAAAARATARADEAAVKSAELDLDYCRITAPIAGRTGSLLVNAGNFVKANDDRTLVTINQIRPIYVSFTVPERSLGSIQSRFRAGGKLEVSASPSNNAGVSESGQLSFVDNMVDTATGTIRLKATFPNVSGALWPGQFVNVVLYLSTEPGALVIPAQALQTGQAGQYVFVVKNDMTVEARPVTVSRTQGQLAVISRGLQADERVVTDGQLRLAPGSRVEIRQGGEARS
ncbi:MAG: efflux RND transporter periplasmic adaptor subunit [Acidobacteriota bacterium]